MDIYSRLRHMIASFDQRLPNQLVFNLQNLQEAERYSTTYEFMLMHLLAQALTVTLHCPSLFWKTKKTRSNISDHPQVEISWNVSYPILTPLYFYGIH